MAALSHFDDQGASRMVDVGDKAPTQRRARARASVSMAKETLAMIRAGSCVKGDVFEVARLAGILAAKRTAELIPLCHPLPLDSIAIRFECPSDDRVAIESEVQVTARTGVEMEALTAASVAALTLYDMCKGVDRSMVVEAIRLEEKSGGRSGHYRRPQGD